MMDGGTVDTAPLAPLARAASLAHARNAHLLLAALLIILAPLAVFALFLAPLASALLLFGVACSAYVILTSPLSGALSAPLDLRLFAGCLVASLLLGFLGGEAHLLFATSDWFLRDAVLADLVLNTFPVFYDYLGADLVLRAPLGMYLLPASVGWAFGLTAAHVALLLQNSALLSIILYLSAAIATGARTRFLVLLILFGPIDIIPLLIETYFYIYPKTGAFVLTPHFMYWNAWVNFWAQFPQFSWAPNHALSGWTLALLLIVHMRKEIDVALLALVSIILLFWSPIALIGAVPLLIWRGLASLSSSLLSRRTLLSLCAACGLAPMLIYLSLDAGSLSHGWQTDKPNFWLFYAAAMVFALPQAWILLTETKLIAPWLKTGLYLSIALMVVMPFYRLGANAEANDMLMRCAIAPMFILAFAFCEAAPKLVDEKSARAIVTTLIIILSAMTGLSEIRRAVSDPAYAINDCNLVTAVSMELPGFPASNYLARTDRTPAWLLGGAGRRLVIEKRECWPGYPLGSYAARKQGFVEP